jgi:DNA-binding NarL/FixJ family response regulator
MLMTSSDQPEAAKIPRILLVDDHAMFREQIAQLIIQDFGLEVCGQADNLRDALALARKTKPDLAIVDISLNGSGGLELLKEFKAQGFTFPSLVLSMHEESLYAERVIAAGARGYITKHQNSDTLQAAIRRVLSGKIYLSERFMEAMVDKMAGMGKAASSLDRLADRELEVLRLIGEGRTTREISDILHLAMTTVDTYRTRIKEKLGLANGTELVRFASRRVMENA